MATPLRSGLVLLAATLGVAPAFAQWIPNGVPVYPGGIQQDTGIIRSDGRGGAYVVWREQRIEHLETDSDSYLQHITPLGFVDAAWPIGGFPIAIESRTQNATVPVVDMDGRNLQRLTNRSGEDGYPAWSHDGTRIAYQRNPTEAESEIHVMSADGKNDQLISDATDSLQEAAPSWSPNDLYLAYQAYELTESSPPVGGIFVMRPDGTGRLMIRPDGFEPEWKPIP